jgi:hypothetical protein
MNTLYLDRLYRVFGQFYSDAYFYGPFVDLFGARERELLFNKSAAVAVSAKLYKDKKTYLGERYGVSTPRDISRDGTAELLHELLYDCPSYQHAQEVLRHVVKCFTARFDDPRVCAKVKSSLSLIRAEHRAVMDAITRFVRHPAEEDIVYDHVAIREEYGFRNSADFVKQMQQELWAMSNDYADHLSTLTYLAQYCRLDERPPLYESAYNLYVPSWRDAPHLEPIQRAIIESAQDSSVIFKLKPRDFEKYVAELFHHFGYQVELTAQTRDGGADVLCMKSEHGIPVRLAIEVKRYAKKSPIGVQLVRQFVGANRSLKANKLVYVTSSRYTSTAISYQQENVDLLELKNLPDVLKWAEVYKADVTRSPKNPVGLTTPRTFR